MSNFSRLIIVLFAFAPFAGLTACSRSAPANQTEPPPNVILITLDTLRADHLGCYGYDRPTSPHMDALATRATVYTRHFATAPWTIPTHGSLFTGKLPFEHGAHTVEVDQPVNNVRRLPLQHTTLAEVFAAEGYATGAFVANDGYLSAGSQFDQGFQTYHVEHVFAEQLNQHAFQWLEAYQDQRFFLFLNYMDTHRPYNTTPGDTDFGRRVVQDNGAALDRLYHAVMDGTGPVPADLVQTVIDQYDTAVANVDAQIGALVAKLQQLDLYDNTVLVVTSDHGEYFGEHYLVEHSKDVYQPALWIPLIFKGRGDPAAADNELPTSSTDIPQMILAEFPPDWQTRYARTFPDRPGEHLVVAENYYTRIKDLFHERWGHRFDRVRRVIYDWPYKFIYSSDGDHELFNLVDDPDETRNLIDVEEQVARRLAAQWRRIRAERRPWQGTDQPPALNQRELERLRSLGYVGP